MAVTKLGKYELHEELGRGGFGTVYRATDASLDRDVALKILHPQLTVDADFIEQFRKEAKRIASVNSPNIVMVYEMGEESGRVFIAMRYLSGGSLRDRLQKEGPLTFEQALQIIKEVSAGLQVAHSKGLIHRDIKPENILFTEDGQAVISDFGLAKAIQSGSSSNSSSLGGVGTPAYKAPELWDGKPPASPATDEYSLACMFTEMLTGKKLFDGETPTQIISQHLVYGAILPEKWPSVVPDGIDNILEKALDKDPAKRYQDAIGFVNALEGIPEAKAEPTPEILRPTPRPKKVRRKKLKPKVQAPIAEGPRVVSALSHSGSDRRGWFVCGVAVLGVAILLVVLLIITLPTGNPPVVTVSTTIPATNITGAQTQPPQIQSLGAIDTLTASCKAEGMLTIIATPASWANYGDIFKLFETTSGVKINSLDENAGSADELAAIEANKGNKGPQAPDIVDVGYAYGAMGKAAGDYQAYKVSTWDRIPDKVLGIPSKDSDGFWTGGYYGIMVLEVNNAVVKTPPTNWADLLKPDYKNQVALAGDPRNSNQAIQAVFASALGNGGSLDNAQPGLDFFKKLNHVGNFVPVIAKSDTFAQGATPIVLTWDYLAFGNRDAFAGNPPITIVYLTPTIASMYVQAVSAYAPHPNCAKLWMDILHSDAGQLAWMRGYTHGVNVSEMESRGVIPADLKAMFSAYSVTGVSPNPDQIAIAAKLITTGWDTTVGVNVK